MPFLHHKLTHKRNVRPTHLALGNKRNSDVLDGHSNCERYALKELQIKMAAPPQKAEVAGDIPPRAQRYLYTAPQKGKPVPDAEGFKSGG